MRASKIVLAGFPAFAYMFTVGTVGFWLPLFVKEVMGYTYTETELIATSYFAALAFGAVASGYITDATRQPELVAFIGLSLNALAVYFMPIYPFFRDMILIRTLQGLGLATAIPVALGSLSFIAGESLGVGLASLFMALGMATGSLAGGLVVRFWGFNVLFKATAVLSMVAAIISLFIKIPENALTRKPVFQTLFRDLTVKVKVVLLGILGRQLFATGVYALLAVYFKTILGLGVVETALALTINPIVQGTLSIPVARRLESRAEILYPLGILLTSIVFFILYFSSGSAWIIYLSMVIQGASFAAVNISGNYLVIKSLPEYIRYTASSLFNFSFNIGWLTGTLIAGLAMLIVTPLDWLLIAGCFIALLAGIVLMGLRTT